MSTSESQVTSLRSLLNRLALRPRREVMLMAALVFVAGFVTFFALGDSRTLGSHEAYAVVPSREMLASGDWIVPRYGGLPRLQKPPLNYWVLATSATLFGDLNEWTARFPAAVFGSLLAILVACWTGRSYGAMAGFCAGIVQATSVWAIIFARKAEVDMLLCLLTTAAMFLVVYRAEHETPRSRFLRWTAIYTILALTWMAKFHYGAVMVLAPYCAWTLFERRSRDLWNLGNPLGLAILAAGAIIWPYLLMQRVPEAWAVMQAETVGRAIGDLSHEPVWFYVPHVLWLTLPWTPLAFATIPASWTAAWKQKDSRERFLWIWFIVQIAIVTISVNKHKHYLNAALPVFSILAGRRLALLVQRVRDGQPLVSARPAVIVASLLAFGVTAGAFVTTRMWPDLATPLWVLHAVLGLGGGLVVWLAATRRSQAAVALAIAVCITCDIGVMGSIMPGRDPRRPIAEFAQTVRGELDVEEDCFVFQMGMRPIVFYVNDPVVRIESVDDLQSQLRQKQSLSIVAFAAALPELHRMGKTTITQEVRDQREPVESPFGRILFLELAQRDRPQRMAAKPLARPQ
ncbi:MAG: glycosyltransferase family 39 protein [Planctomycetaceae bacterium]